MTLATMLHRRPCVIRSLVHRRAPLLRSSRPTIAYCNHWILAGKHETDWRMHEGLLSRRSYSSKDITALSQTSRSNDLQDEAGIMDSDAEPYDASGLKKLLDVIDPAGSFATSGTFALPGLSAKIEIASVGTIGLPLHPVLAKYMKDTVAEKAPFGRGPETLLDESVRKAWQIDPSQVTMTGWKDTVSNVVKEACYELGISNENVQNLGIEAHLYKVLLYEKGGHFKAHKDTVKQEGMFGTLVFQLPSVFEGSDSVVSHRGETKRFKISEDCETTSQYMAFYGDCEHEIMPVTEGWRFCLVYNLVVTKPHPTGVVPDGSQLESMVKKLEIEAAKWKASPTGKLGYCLDHEYTLDSLDFGKLKGRDAVVMSALRHAKDDAGNRMFDLCLVFFSQMVQLTPHEYDNQYDVEKIIFEDGSSVTEPKTTPPADMKAINIWCDKVMYTSHKDGFVKEMKDLTDKERTKIEENDYYEIQIGNRKEVEVVHHDAGNEGGGHTTWYRSAVLVLQPACQKSDES